MHDCGPNRLDLWNVGNLLKQPNHILPTLGADHKPLVPKPRYKASLFALQAPIPGASVSGKQCIPQHKHTYIHTDLKIEYQIQKKENQQARARARERAGESKRVRGKRERERAQ